MTWFLVGGAAICGWAMLRMMGGERERHIREREAAVAAARLAAEPAPPTTPTSKPPALGGKRTSRQAA